MGDGAMQPTILRDYQLESARGLWRQAVCRNDPASLLVAPCGSGKTVVLAALMRKLVELKQWRILFLAHRREIVHQTLDRCREAGFFPGVVMSGELPSPERPVQIASIGTYLRWRGHKLPPDYPDLVVYDEAHGALSRTAGKLLADMREHGTRLIGATATPIRSDGQGLGRLFNSLVLAPTVADLTARGCLVPMRYFVGVVPDLTGIKLVARDYSQDELQAVLDKEALIGDVVENYGRLARGRKALLFATGVQHSLHLRDRLRCAGIRAEHVDGQTARRDRDAVHAMLTNDETDVVCNANVYIEGTDLPIVACLIDAQPTKSLGRYLQKAGRGLRTHPGKTDCIYLDHAGNVYEHGRVEESRSWRLTQGRELGELLKRERKRSGEHACDNCGFLFAGEECPNCHHVRARPIGELAPTIAAELTELGRAKGRDAHVATDTEKRQWYREALAVTRGWGKRDGMAAYAFRAKFGAMPPLRWLSDGPCEASEPVKSYLRSRLIRASKSVRAWSSRRAR